MIYKPLLPFFLSLCLPFSERIDSGKTALISATLSTFKCEISLYWHLVNWAWRKGVIPRHYLSTYIIQSKAMIASPCSASRSFSFPITLSQDTWSFQSSGGWSFVVTKIVIGAALDSGMSSHVSAWARWVGSTLSWTWQLNDENVFLFMTPRVERCRRMRWWYTDIQ